jgi:hypothetical protein
MARSGNRDSDELLYQCGVDDLSETEIVDAVHHLNYDIDRLIINVMAIDKDARPQSGSQEVSNPVPGGVLHKALEDCWLSKASARDMVVEFFLRDLIVQLLHTHYFDGPCFFAVGSRSLRDHLENMMSELAAGGELTYSKRWLVSSQYNG